MGPGNLTDTEKKKEKVMDGTSKYRKTLDQLNRSESCATLRKINCHFGNRTTRENIHLILAMRSELWEGWKSTYFFFEKYEQNGQSWLRANFNVRDENQYPKSTTAGVTDITSIVYILQGQLVENTDVPIPDSTASQSQDPVTPSRLSISSSSDFSDSSANTNFPVNPKLYKYHAEMGVDRFLTKIELAAKCHRWNSPDTVRFATICLSISDGGADLLNLCNADDFNQWHIFKKKILLMDSISNETYQNEFDKYQRKPDQPCAQLMGKLKELFVKSQGYSTDQQLNSFEMSIIRKRFFGCLDPTLRKRLKDKFNDAQHFKTYDLTQLDKLAHRCMLIEQTFELGFHQPDVPPKPEQTTTNTDSHSKSGSTPNFDPTDPAREQIRKLCRKFRQYFKSYNVSKLHGFCLSMIKNGGKCRQTGHCQFHHHKPPQEVLDYVDSRFKRH